MSTVLLDYRDDTPYKVTQSMWDGTSNEWQLGCVDILTRQILFAYHKSFHKVLTLCHVRKETRRYPSMKVAWVRPRYDRMSGVPPRGIIGELIEKGGLKSITSRDHMTRYFTFKSFATVSETFTVIDQLVREPYIQELLDPALRISEHTKPDRKYQGNFVYSWQFQTLHDVLDCPETYEIITPEQLSKISKLLDNLANVWNMGYDMFVDLCKTKTLGVENILKAEWPLDEETTKKFAKYLTKWFNYHAAKCWITQWEFINRMDWGGYTALAKRENRHRVSLALDLPDWECVGTTLNKKPTLNTGFFALTKIFGGHKEVRWDHECKYGIIVAKCQNEYRYDLLVYQFKAAEPDESDWYKPLAALRGQTGASLIEGVYAFEPSDGLKSMFGGEWTQIIDDRILESTFLVHDLAPYVEAEKLNSMHTERDGWIPAGDVHSELEWNLTEKKILRRTAALIKGHKMKHIASNYDAPVYEWAVTAPDKCDLMFVHKAFKLTGDDVTRRIYMLALRVFLANTDLVHSRDGQVSSKKMYLRKPTPAEACLLKDRLGLDIGDMKIANLSIADVWTLCGIAKEVDLDMISTSYQVGRLAKFTEFLETGFAKAFDDLIPNDYRPSNIGDLIQLGAKSFIAEFLLCKMFEYKKGWFRSHLAIQKRKFGWYHYNGVNGMVQDY